jgi:hypothetical protein
MSCNHVFDNVTYKKVIHEDYKKYLLYFFLPKKLFGSMLCCICNERVCFLMTSAKDMQGSFCRLFLCDTDM